ncbi:MAG: betaine--homocysteine S-methyltransferase [Geminicoccaceae bacterium]
MSETLQALLAERSVLLADGGMGTGLFRRGLETGDSPELWNVDHPDRVTDVHREFVTAGSDLILTNSFGGNAFRLKLHAAEGRVRELNMAAARAARAAAAEAGRPVLVAGSIGPTGEILAPVGTLDPADAEAAFSAQAAALVEGGVDLLWVETMSSAEELTAAVRAAGAFGLPVCATMSFDTNGRTMMGLTPDAALALAHSLDPAPAGFGANCGIGPAQLLATLLGFSRLERRGEVIIAKANCGIPEYRDGAIHYTGTESIMADYAILARDAGARIIGGCCGTAGTHLAAMRRALDTAAPGPVPDIARIERLLGPVTAPATDPVAAPPRERRRSRPAG